MTKLKKDMSNKKVALMTWHHVENYGTALQAYALKTVIEKLGFHVDLIDYRRNNDGPLKKRTFYKAVKEKLNGAFQLIKTESEEHFKFTSKCFRSFYDELFSYTIPCKYNQDFEKINAEYDYFVCGSDQIWGPEWFDPRYFLDFVSDPRRIIAYAPSLGVSEINDELLSTTMGKLINRFQHISIREETGVRLVKQLTKRTDIVNTIDPVLLIREEEWSQIGKEIKTLPQKYIFIFFLKNNSEYFQAAIDKANKLGLQQVIFHCTQSEDNEFANIDELTPQELLSYIRFADYVCTDSFHIMVLAIIFNVQFEVFKKEETNKKNSKNSRISDLLDRLLISNAQYQSDRDFGPKINYNSVKEKLDELREQSMNYIKNTLMTIPEVSVKAITSNYIKSADYHCSGMFHAAYQKRFYSNKNSKLDKYLLSRMKFWNFTLEEKCYFCRYLKPIERTINNRKPLFYKKLEAELYNENVPVVKIFNKYYLLYDLPFSIRNYINFDLRKRTLEVLYGKILHK